MCRLLLLLFVGVDDCCWRCRVLLFVDVFCLLFDVVVVRCLLFGVVAFVCALFVVC